MSKEVILSSDAPSPIGPYSQAILTNGTLYVSGQIALDTEGELYNEEITEETDKVMQNLGAILKAAGMDYSNIVKCSIFIRDMTKFSKINAAYGKYFPTNPPARETIEVVRLPKDANVEISCIAIK